MICRKCPQYRHSWNKCTKDARCRKCSEFGEAKPVCKSEYEKCFNYGGDHECGSQLCLNYKYQEEILGIQNKVLITRGQANANKPHYAIMNFSSAVRRISQRKRNNGEEADAMDEN